MKCRRWIAGGGISHVKQHDFRHHAGCGENTIDSGADMQQLQVNQTVAYSAGEQARLTAKLVGFLIRDSRPATLTLDRDFREFLALNPKFVIPDTKKIRTVTNAMYNAARDTVLDYIHPLKWKGLSALRGMVACVSLDMWTDATQMTYIGVLLHTIKSTNGGFEKKEFCLACKEVEADHVTAQVVQQYLEATLKEFGIPVKAIFRVVHDGDAELIQAVRKVGLPSSLSLTHSLQRTIAVSLEGEDDFLTTLKRARNAVSGARHSNVLAAYQRETQVSTQQHRTSPTAHALGDNCQPAAFEKVSEPDERQKSGDTSLLGQVVALYKPFRGLITELQAGDVTSPLVVPAYLEPVEGLSTTANIAETSVAGTDHPASSTRHLISVLHPSVQRLARQARTDLTRRFKLRRMLPLAVAPFLDPCTKNLRAMGAPDDVLKKAWRVIQEQTDRTMTVLKKANGYVEGRGEKRGCEGDFKTTGSLRALFFAQSKHYNNLAVVHDMEPALDFEGVEIENREDVASEITNYLSKSVQTIGLEKIGTLEYWWNLCEDCPALTIVAMHYLCIPASSSSVRRLVLRTRLIESGPQKLPETFEKLTFTRINWDDSLCNVRLEDERTGGDESKSGNATEEETEGEEKLEAPWQSSEAQGASELDSEIRAKYVLGLDDSMAYNIDELDDAFWDELGEETEPWLDAE
jgi:hypothetical protein